jgi:glycosyltransferase involved in cell wall biosynthesis
MANEPATSVLLLTDADVFAGTERHILDLAVALRKQNVKVQIGCPAPSPLADHAAKQNIPVLPIAKRGQVDWRVAGLLRHLIRDGKIDLIHAHNGRTALAAAIGLFGSSRGKLIVTQHFLEPAHARRIGISASVSRIIHRWMNRRTDRFIAISNAVADAAKEREHLMDDRIVVIHNGTSDCRLASLRPTEEVRAELSIAPGAPLIVCAARLEPEKDISSLVSAMRSVCDEFIAAQCIIAGRGTLHGLLTKQIQESGLQNNVRLLGFREDVLSLIHAGDCFVLPSLAEPFGLVLLEAMAMAKPVVATRTGGPVEIVESEVTGVLVPPSDPAALGGAIVRLLRNPSTALEMGKRGRKRFEEHFTSEQMAGATAEVYREATGSDARSLK